MAVMVFNRDGGAYGLNSITSRSRVSGFFSISDFQNVRAAHFTSPMTSASAGQGRVGHSCVSGLSLTSCHASRRLRFPWVRLVPLARAAPRLGGLLAGHLRGQGIAGL